MFDEHAWLIHNSDSERMIIPILNLCVVDTSAPQIDKHELALPEPIALSVTFDFAVCVYPPSLSESEQRAKDMLRSQMFEGTGKYEFTILPRKSSNNDLRFRAFIIAFNSNVARIPGEPIKYWMSVEMRCTGEVKGWEPAKRVPTDV